MNAVELYSGGFTLVSDEDYVKVNLHRWTESSGYIRRLPGKPVIYLHRFIMGPTKLQQIDHINGDPLDNRRENLRIVTQAQNNANNRSTSTYKGVSYDRKRNLWQAKIGYQYTTIHLGRFKTALEAAKSYDEAAKKYFGEFARLNLPG